MQPTEYMASCRHDDDVIITAIESGVIKTGVVTWHGSVVDGSGGLTLRAARLQCLKTGSMDLRASYSVPVIKSSTSNSLLVRHPAKLLQL